MKTHVVRTQEKMSSNCAVSVEALPLALFLPVFEALITAEIGDGKFPATGTLRAQASLLLPRASITARSKKCDIQVRCNH